MKHSAKFQPPRIDLPADVRESLIALLAEALVLDFQANQAVSWPTVKKASLLNRGLGAEIK